MFQFSWKDWESSASTSSIESHWWLRVQKRRLVDLLRLHVTEMSGRIFTRIRPESNIANTRKFEILTVKVNGAGNFLSHRFSSSWDASCNGICTRAPKDWPQPISDDQFYEHFTGYDSFHWFLLLFFSTFTPILHSWWEMTDIVACSRVSFFNPLLAFFHRGEVQLLPFRNTKWTICKYHYFLSNTWLKKCFLHILDLDLDFLIDFY